MGEERGMSLPAGYMFGVYIAGAAVEYMDVGMGIRVYRDLIMHGTETG